MIPNPSDNHPVDRLVRDHLLAEAATVDAESLRLRIRATVPPPASNWQRRVSWVAGLGALAASLLIVVALLIPPTRSASAAELLVAAQSAHRQKRDRAYELTVEIETGLARWLDLPPIVRRSTIWTRGDQFTIETPSPHPESPPVRWGQDADGRVWLALSRRRALLYEPDEVTEPIARACDLMSLRTVALLSDLLTGYDLARRDTNRPGEPVRIEAQLRPDPTRAMPRFREVVLELDAETKVIRKAVLKRMVTGPAGGLNTLTLTFELTETADRPDDIYTLRGNIDANASIFDRRDQPDRFRDRIREDLMKRFQERIMRP